MKQQLGREVNRNAGGGNNVVLTLVFFVPSLPAVSSLRSTLEVHLEQNDLPPLQELDSLPEDITVGQGADVWRAAVEFKRR